MNKPGIIRAIESAGSMSELARQLGVSYQSVQQWRDREQIPAERVLAVEKLTGVSRHVLRPDLYPRSDAA